MQSSIVTQFDLFKRQRLDIEELEMFRADFLFEKLEKDCTVSSSREAEALFRELKRYLWITHLDRGRVSWNMYSSLVDEVWHQFVLYTAEYREFSIKYFGGFVHHRPSNSPMRGTESPSQSFASFCLRYEEVFGEPLSAVWIDENNVRLERRVQNARFGEIYVQIQGPNIELIDNEALVFSVNDIAREALEFIVNNKVFYVRELPGDLTDEEKLGLAIVLVGRRILKVRP